MPILQEVHTWAACIGGHRCINTNCSAFVTDSQVGLYAPNDNNAQMADMGDDQSIFQQAFLQVPAGNQL